MYKIKSFKDGYYLVDSRGKIIESFDYGEYSDAKRLLEKLEAMASVESNNDQVFKSILITNEDQRLQIPAEEFRPHFKSVIASSKEEAIRKIQSQYGCTVTDIQID